MERYLTGNHEGRYNMEFIDDNNDWDIDEDLD